MREGGGGAPRHLVAHMQVSSKLLLDDIRITKRLTAPIWLHQVLSHLLITRWFHSLTRESSSGSATPTMRSENSLVTSTGLVSVPNGASNLQGADPPVRIYAQPCTHVARER